MVADPKGEISGHPADYNHFNEVEVVKKFVKEDLECFDNECVGTDPQYKTNILIH